MLGGDKVMERVRYLQRLLVAHQHTGFYMTLRSYRKKKSYRKGDNEVLQNKSLTGRGTLRSYRTVVLQEGGH